MRIPGFLAPLALSLAVHGLCLRALEIEWPEANEEEAPEIELDADFPQGDAEDDPFETEGAADAGMPVEVAPFDVTVLPADWQEAPDVVEPPPPAEPPPPEALVAAVVEKPAVVEEPEPSPDPGVPIEEPAEEPVVADMAEPPADAPIEPPLPEEVPEELLGEANAEPPPEADDDGEAHEENLRKMREARKGMRIGKPLVRRRPPGKDRRPPCPPDHPAIARVADTHYGVERVLVDYYATHLRALAELGSVWAHKNKETGKLDGFRVGLARCSLLRQAGLRSGDIVHDVNGREIHTVLEAVGAYFALRTETHLQLNVSRRGEPVLLKYDILTSKKDRKAAREERKAMKEERKAAREAAREVAKAEASRKKAADEKR